MLKDEDVPVYLRRRGRITAAIMAGDYRPGDQLPSVRAFAAEYRANPSTVAKVYQSLQDAGHVEVRRGVGMFVVPNAGERLLLAEREHFLSYEWPRICGFIDPLDLDRNNLLGRERT